MNSLEKRAELQELRALLKRQFPDAHREEPALLSPKSETESVLSAGIPGWAAAEIPEKGLIELTGADSAGAGLVLWGLIRNLLASGRAVALVDGADSCDVAHAWPEEILARLLWIRCHGVKEAMQAMDLLVRDGNVHHLILDLQNARSESFRIPHPLWYRLRNVAEESGLWMLVVSPKPMVPCAVMRCRLTRRFTLDDLSTPRETLLESVTLEAQHHRNRRRSALPALRAG